MERFQTLVPTSEQKSYVDKVFSGVTFYHRKDEKHKKSSYFQQYYGMLGQVLVADLFNYPRPNRVTDSFDIAYNNVFIDVKTQRINVVPKLYHELHVLSRQLKALDDFYYLFLFYNPEKDLFYVVGIMSGLGIKNVSNELNKGQESKAENGYQADCEQHVLKVRDTAPCELPL